MAPTGDSREPAGNRNLRTPLLPETATSGSSSSVARARCSESRSPLPKRVCGALALYVSAAWKEEEVVPAAAKEEEVAPLEVVKATVDDDDSDKEYNDSSDSTYYYHSLDSGTHIMFRVDYSSGKTMYLCPVCQDREFKYKEEVQVHALRLFHDNVGVPDDIERHRQIAWDTGYKYAFKKRSTSS